MALPNRILIVEDERITATKLHDTLQDLGYVVTAVVSTGSEAIAEAERSKPDVALMNVRIKGIIDGAEAARILRERFGTPVVYVTAHEDREAIDRIKASTPLGYIVIPFQKSDLQASIEVAIDARRKAEKATARHQRLTDVLSAVLMGIISVDQREIVLLFNPAAEDLTGWNRGEALGNQVKSVFRLVNSSTGQPLPLRLEEVLKTGALTEFNEALLVTKTGKTTPVAGNIAPVRGVGGNAPGAVIVFESVLPGVENPYLNITAKQEDANGSLTFGRFHIIAASKSMKQLLSYALRAARSEAATILLEGETGTGKDLLAQFIHYSSSRCTHPFVTLNCAAIPEALLESELFGHEAGAFTDARSLKKGLFEVANGGTLFLDEIGDMAPHMQAKLLRAVEEKSFRRLGGIQNIEIDVRVLAATNRNMAAAARAGKFRLDLYHRLNVIQIVVPPLRDRREDIIPLAEHFLSLYRRKHNVSVPTISPGAASRLFGHDWPGNVRELRNVIERAIINEDTDVILQTSVQFDAEHENMGLEQRHDAERPELRADFSLANAERNVIMRALAETGGNQTKAAKLLGITRDVLRHYMKRFGLLKPLRQKT